MRYSLLIAALALATTAAAAQPMPSRIGQPMPPLHFEAILQGDPSGTLPRAGHPLVIEFWTTWCPACVDNIAHLNALSDEFDKQGVDFLLLSNETRDKVEPFLAKHPMHGTVALDPEFSTNSGLREPGLPFTLLVRADARVAAAVRPNLVTPEVLTALLRNERLPLTALNLRTSSAGNAAFSMFGESVPAVDADAAVRVVIRPGMADSSPEGYMSWSENFFHANGANLRKLLQVAARVSPQQIVLPASLEAPYSVQAWVPELPGYSVMPLVLSSLEATAGLKLRREPRLLPTYTLGGFPGKLTRSTKTSSLGGSPRPGVIDYESVNAAGLANTVGELLKTTVMADPSPSGLYSLHLTWDPGDKDALRKALAAQGLTLKGETRLMDVFVFEPVEGSAQKK